MTRQPSDEPGTRGHEPVLSAEVLAALAPTPGARVLDCTIGLGGHAAEIARAIAPGGWLIGLDADPDHAGRAREALADAPAAVTVRHANFARARAVLDELGVGRVDAVLADLGVASSQLEDPARGFSFDAAASPDMRFDPSLPRTAAELVATLSERELADLLRRYGEEPAARRIAQKIVAERQRRPIETARELAELIRGVAPKRAAGAGIDPATRAFMALRIAVNGELEALDRLLEGLPGILAPGGRVAIISFHSLEDRRVKRGLAALDPSGRAPRPVQAGAEERERNPRSRSAKLRAVTASA